MEFVDRIIKCMDCGGDFVFTAGEQLFFFDKQFKNDPKRCKPCKAKRAASTAAKTGESAGNITLRTETRTSCSDCGIETTVPFKPTQGRPVLCRLCFQQKKGPMTASPEQMSQQQAQA
ncbi:MAG: zinc-ribbon domain containing protein [Acidobacteriaceae bacterium]